MRVWVPLCACLSHQDIVCTTTPHPRPPLPTHSNGTDRLYHKVNLGFPIMSLLLIFHISCGPARHATQLAQSGVNVWALDASAPMLAYARQLAQQQGADVTFVQGDMGDFEIQVCRWKRV